MATCVEMIEAKFHCALPEHFVDKVRQRVAISFAENLQAISGARELLSELIVPYCIASNGPREKIQQSLSASGLLSVLKGPIFSAYDVGHWKPSPGLFLHAARAMGAEPRRCAVVEDSEPGIEAGLAAGMTVFALQLTPAELTTNPRHGVIYLKSLEALLEHL
ncbi:6-phosphogluconate phosphatase [compost metagenome]